ncbi:MAG: (4Fe-4S)-binding protein [Bacteroidota bacterium]
MTNKVTKVEFSEYKKDKEIAKEYSNGEITVFWRSELCIHSANCLLTLPRVFSNRRKPWINLAGAESKEIMKAVDTCPSRALTYLKSNTFRIQKPRKTKKQTPKFARIQIMKDGPALVTGNFIVRDGAKKKIKLDSEVAALCRCGHSEKKPFCDGTHLIKGFKD